MLLYCDPCYNAWLSEHGPDADQPDDVACIEVALDKDAISKILKERYSSINDDAISAWADDILEDFEQGKSDCM